MADDPKRQRRRQFLEKERSKLNTAQEWLQAGRQAGSEDNMTLLIP